MDKCKDCINYDICKWIGGRKKLQEKLDNIKITEGSPFSLKCNCRYSFCSDEYGIIEKDLEQDLEKDSFIDIV